MASTSSQTATGESGRPAAPAPFRERLALDEPGARSGRLVVLAVAAVTVLGFALRVVGMNQTLFGDERYTYSIVTDHGLGGVWHEVYTTSITPPLHYFLAWVFVQFGGNGTVMVRLPSLILGTALIPLMFVLGRRIGGTRVGLFAAGLMALSPFAIFYSNEARAYETMVFLVVLSTVALLRATDGKGRIWWVVYAVSACAALWAHYTAAFVLIAQAAWALWARPRFRREVVIASAAIVAGFLPWVPGYLEQRNNPGVDIFNNFSSVTFGSVFGFPLKTLISHPFVGLPQLPGTLGLILALVLAVSALAVLLYRPALRDRVPGPRSEPALAVLLALATPVGLLLYSLVGTKLFSAPRELSASQPALILVIALLLAFLTRVVPARLATVAVAGMAGLLGAIAIESVGADYQRPPYRQAAHYLDSVAGDSPVVEFRLSVAPDARLHQSTLQVYFKRPHRLYVSGQNDDAVWRAAESAGTPVYFVQPQETKWLDITGFDKDPPGIRARIERLGGPDGRAIQTASKSFPGFYPIIVHRYQGAVTGRLEGPANSPTITWSLGKRVSVVPGAAVGAINFITPSNKPLLLAGWGLDARRHTPVDWFLMFSRGRLFAVSAGGLHSKDADKITGSSWTPAGFALGLHRAPADHSSIRVFAVVGNRASELPLTPLARRALGQQ